MYYESICFKRGLWEGSDSDIIKAGFSIPIQILDTSHVPSRRQPIVDKIIMDKFRYKNKMALIILEDGREIDIFNVLYAVGFHPDKDIFNKDDKSNNEEFL